MKKLIFLLMLLPILFIMSGATTVMGVAVENISTIGRVAIANVSTLDGVTLAVAVPDTVATPVFSPVAGDYEAGNEPYWSITCATEGATIYYTINANTTPPPDPTTSSTLYTSPVEIPLMTSDYRIKAIGVKDGFVSSSIVLIAYYIFD